MATKFKSKQEKVYAFVDRVMSGYGRAGVNNVKVATTKLSNRVLPLEAWSVAATSSSSSSSSSSSTTTSTTTTSSNAPRTFQNAVRQDRETDQDLYAYRMLPVVRPARGSSNVPLPTTAPASNKRKRLPSSSPAARPPLKYRTVELMLHQPWLTYFEQATQGLNDARLKRIVGNTLHLVGCETTVLRRNASRPKRKPTRSTAKSSSSTTNSVKGNGEEAHVHGIVLRDTSEAYVILDKRTEKRVRVLKEGTVLRMHVGRTLMDGTKRNVHYDFARCSRLNDS